MKTIQIIAFCILTGSLLGACKKKEKPEDAVNVTNDTIEMVQEFIDRLMPALGKGVTGADGSISIDLKNGKSLFLWGDCFIGDVINNQRPDKASPLVCGNVFTVLSEDTVVSYFNGTRETPLSWLSPPPMGKDTSCWYWPGNGFVRDGILHLFMSEFYKTGQGMFDFAYVTCDYFRLDANTFQVISKENFPAANVNGVHYGHAVVDDGEYIYSYGTRADSAGFATVHVARAQMKDNVLQNWQYYAAGQWTDQPAKSTPLEGIKTSVSEQFNMFKCEGKYVLVTQTRDRENKVVSAIADAPAGPFYNEKEIFKVAEPLEAKKMITYNTMVHPQYQDQGRILMCYNVNCLEFFDLYKDATLYKPRFFWMPVSMMLN